MWFMAVSKKSVVSPAVVKAVQSAVVVPVVERSGKVSTAEYLREYLAEQTSGGTWESLCKRTGFRLENVRQCITMLRSEYRKAKQDSAEASPAFLAMLKKAGKAVDVWADEKAAEKFPFLAGSGTRNTEKAKLRASWESEELSL
jgi:hypothetical protein